MKKLSPQQKQNPLLVEMTSAQSISRAVKQYRLAFNMSQAELAKRAGMIQAEIAKLEAGKANPTLKSLDDLAKAMNARLDVGFRRR